MASASEWLRTGWPSSAWRRQRRSGVSIHRVRVFHAPGCHLCERALATLAELRREVEFELEAVDISDDPELEERHREWLPVVEIDGQRAFVYHLDRQAFLRRVSQTRAP